MWLSAPNITCTHGFSTKHGGISTGPFESLNLGGSQDDPDKIAHNRKLALNELNLNTAGLCTLKQVHGNSVRIAKEGAQEGDALVTDRKDLTLAISIADCYPLLFFDKDHSVIGAAHAGWRGTQSGIAGETIKAMIKLGARPETTKVAMGQGICQNNFEVGKDVIEKFQEAGFPQDCWKENKIDLVKCNLFILHKNNVPPENIWVMNRCTFEPDFFSHRRDKGVTGRMWGMISMA
jgi:polyphenol oxidase